MRGNDPEECASTTTLRVPLSDKDLVNGAPIGVVVLKRPRSDCRHIRRLGLPIRVNDQGSGQVLFVGVEVVSENAA